MNIRPYLLTIVFDMNITTSGQSHDTLHPVGISEIISNIVSISPKVSFCFLKYIITDIVGG